MLNKLGSFVATYRWWVIGAWIVLAIAITVFSPKLSSVTSSDQTSFLPSKYETVQAQHIAEKAFPATKNDVEILLVERQDGNVLTAGDKQAVQAFAGNLQAKHLPSVAAVVASPQAVSADGTA
ncbi:MAG TPA: hypothetical protein VHC98_02180, partial [Candidatus Saccharimonadales bacterium]|nr:hypothetical protein [Candidatus Saccharimonadales bacterium]